MLTRTTTRAAQLARTMAPLLQAFPSSTLAVEGARVPSSTLAVEGARVPREEGPTHPLSFSEIPGPKQWPFLGSLPAMLTDPAFDFTRLPRLWTSYFQRYGPIFRLSLPGQGDMVYLSLPADIEHLMRATQEQPIRPFLMSLKKIRHETSFFDPQQTGILTEQGEEWWRVRRLVQQHTFRPQTVLQYLPQMDQVTREFVDRLASIRDEKDELPGNFMEELFKWSLESVCLVTLDRRMGCLDDSDSEGLEIIRASQEMFEALSSLEYGVHWWRFWKTPKYRSLKRNHDVLLGLAIEAVERAQKNLKEKVQGASDRGGDGESLTFVEGLLATPGLSFKDVVTHILDFFFAATDTTSMTLIFTLYNLARHPEKQEILREELLRVLGPSPTGHITPQQLNKMPYTKACVRESLRLYAVAGFVIREAHKDLVLHGYSVPKGTIVFGSQSEAGRNPDKFRDPDAFLPERWLRAGGGKGGVDQYASIPFSMGPRMCIGRRLAVQEVYVMLARLFQQYELEYNQEPWDPFFKTILTPDKPQNFTLKKLSS